MSAAFSSMPAVQAAKNGGSPPPLDEPPAGWSIRPAQELDQGIWEWAQEAIEEEVGPLGNFEPSEESRSLEDDFASVTYSVLKDRNSGRIIVTTWSEIGPGTEFSVKDYPSGSGATVNGILNSLSKEWEGPGPRLGNPDGYDSYSFAEHDDPEQWDQFQDDLKNIGVVLPRGFTVSSDSLVLDDGATSTMFVKNENRTGQVLVVETEDGEIMSAKFYEDTTVTKLFNSTVKRMRTR